MNAPAARGHAIPATWVSLASQFDALDSMNVSAHTALDSMNVSAHARSRCPADFDRARFDFFGKRSLFLSVVAILMLPYATILLPLYILLGKLGLQNSLIGLSLVLIMFQLPFGTLMMRNSFESVPRELEEAALVDGCSNVGALRHISLRMVAPGVVTVVLFAFLASWNEFLAPLIFLNDADKFTLPIMLVNVRSGSYGAVDFGALQAGVVVAMIPALALYLVLQRYYVSGLLNGALRG